MANKLECDASNEKQQFWFDIFSSLPLATQVNSGQHYSSCRITTCASTSCLGCGEVFIEGPIYIHIHYCMHIHVCTFENLYERICKLPKLSHLLCRNKFYLLPCYMLIIITITITIIIIIIIITAFI